MLVTSGLDDYLVLVTGSSRGIGAATARVLQREGARVVLHGRTRSTHLLDLANELDAPYVMCDVTNDDDVRTVVGDLLAEEGQLHALVNCAGSISFKPFLESTDEHWMREIDINLLGPVRVCRAVVPAMLKSGYGRIVNMTSGQGRSSRAMAHLSAKAALDNFTVSLAKEVAPTISVNAVSGGFIQSDSTRWNETVWRHARSALVGRPGTPGEIAEILAFLASDRASFITGQVITADGGYTVSGR